MGTLYQDRAMATSPTSRTLALAYRPSAMAATVLLGLMAGFFFAFAHDVAPAMTHLGASQYVATQQWINVAVRNAAFGPVYFGSAVLVFAPALLAAVARRQGRALAWGLVAVLYFVGVFWLTRSVNIPINQEMAQWNAATPPPDWAALRDRWNAANAWRAAASLACFAAAVVLTAGCGLPFARPPLRNT